MVVGDHDGVVMCFGMKKGEAVVSIAFYQEKKSFSKREMPYLLNTCNVCIFENADKGKWVVKEVIYEG